MAGTGISPPSPSTPLHEQQHEAAEALCRALHALPRLVAAPPSSSASSAAQAQLLAPRDALHKAVRGLLRAAATPELIAALGQQHPIKVLQVRARGVVSLRLPTCGCRGQGGV